MCDNDIDPYRGYTKQQADKLRAMMCKDDITSTAEPEAIDPPPAPESHLQNNVAVSDSGTPQRLTL